MKRKWIKATVWTGWALMLASCNLVEVLETSREGDTQTTLNAKVVRGLKTALEVGIDSGSAMASKANGYLAHKVIKIALPEEAEQALEAAERVGAMVKPFAEELKAMNILVNLTAGVDRGAFTSNLGASTSLLGDIAGLESIGDSLVKYMNRAAEYAAPRSGPIFKNAITSMSIQDGMVLLNAADSTAVTSYLSGKTFDPLSRAYAPIVDSTLEQVPLTRYWGDFRTTYNAVLARYQGLVAFQDSWNGNTVVSQVSVLRIDALQPVSYRPIETESLGAWTTDKALGGLFYLVGEEEKEIRRDPFSYVRGLAAGISDLLSEVFGDIMEMNP